MRSGYPLLIWAARYGSNRRRNDGIASDYLPTATGFRVYLSVPYNLTPATANAYRWHIQWTAASTTRSYYYAGTMRVAMRQGSKVYFLHGDVRHEAAG